MGIINKNKVKLVIWVFLKQSIQNMCFKKFQNFIMWYLMWDRNYNFIKTLLCWSTLVQNTNEWSCIFFDFIDSYVCACHVMKWYIFMWNFDSWHLFGHQPQCSRCMWSHVRSHITYCISNHFCVQYPKYPNHQNHHFKLLLW